MRRDRETFGKDIGIEVKVTDNCNQRCFHCVNNDGIGHGRDIDGHQIIRQLTQWVENHETSSYRIKEVRMTGGEPLLNLNAVTQIAKCCSSLKIRSGINTNATLMNKSAASLLRDSGLGTVKISFDSLDEGTLKKMRGPQASLAAVLAGIQNARDLGFHTILRFTLCSHNRDQLIPCYHMAQIMGVDNFQIKPLVCSGRSVNSGSFLSRDEINAAFLELARVVNGTRLLPEILCWISDMTSSVTDRVCASLDKLYISPDGKASTCNYHSGTVSMGNLIQDGFEGIFQKRRLKTLSIGNHRILDGCPQIEYFINSPGLYKTLTPSFLRHTESSVDQWQ